MKHLLTAFILSLLTITLSSCSYQAPKDPNSSFYAPPVGSQLILHQTLTIPANNTEVRIQNGKVIHSSWDLDTYYANCHFELRDIANVERTVQPDTFNISRAHQDTENVMLNTPTVVASAGGGDGGPPLVDYITIMDLYSPRQPEVMRISCQHWNEANDGEHLNINQIRKTLDGLFTLTLATD